MYPFLKFSYDDLSNDTIRCYFLYCGLFSEYFNILKRDLIDFWIGEGYFDTNDTYKWST